MGCCNGLNKWNPFSFEFTAKGSTTDIFLAEAFPSRDYVGLDNVSVQAVAAPVPEPETYALMLAGLGLMGFVARRRKQRSAA
ncbi:MAG: PEP-CTERM sorting domain-containing protein [Rhodocyclales bacterium]|nr:PEP-CTERM sorting domain-containing protein [Rhodocyclales bacterium]